MSTQSNTPGDPERTGPVTSEVISGAWSPDLADAGTGPLPVVGENRWAPGGQDPSSTTAPHAVRGNYGNQPPRPAPRPVPPQRRSGRKANRAEHVVAFVLHQFPIGHLPVAETRPSRQLPVSGTRQNHPRSAMLGDASGLARVRAGETASRPRGELLPAELANGYQPWGDLGELAWEREFRPRTGTVWPTDEPPEDPIVLPPDTIVDHLGDGFGRFLAPLATPFAQRGLPPEYLERAYRRFRVVCPLPVWRTSATPWFGQPGGGLRYRALAAVVDLAALGYLLELTREPEASKARTLRLSTADGPQEESR